MPNIKPFSLFPTLSDNLLSNRFDQIDRLFSQLTGSISQGQFTLQFDLGKNVKIEKADLSSGLLTIAIEYELPEEEKRQTIAIENKDKS